jgi:hypothetical protein
MNKDFNLGFSVVLLLADCNFSILDLLYFCRSMGKC